MGSDITASWRTPTAILLSGSFVVLLAIGLRTSFGLFLKPMSVDLGWGREIFAFGIVVVAAVACGVVTSRLLAPEFDWLFIIHSFDLVLCSPLESLKQVCLKKVYRLTDRL